MVNFGWLSRWPERGLSDFSPSQHHKCQPNRKVRLLAVLAAANGMPNIRIWSASSSYFGQSPATSNTAKLMLWLHGGCYKRLKNLLRDQLFMSACPACGGSRPLLFVICWEALAEDRTLTIYTFSYIFRPCQHLKNHWSGSAAATRT